MRAVLPNRPGAWRAMVRTVVAAGLLWIVGMGPSASLLAAGGYDETVEYSIKGAYLFNFTRFVEWPAGAPDSEGFVIGVLGCDDAAVHAIESTLRDKRAGDGRPIVVRVVNPTTADLSPCRLVFIGRNAAVPISAVRDAIGSAPVLLVGDEEGAAQRGCAINFAVSGDTVRIDINLQRAEQAHLKLSGRLANVARLVRDAEVD